MSHLKAISVLVSVVIISASPIPVPLPGTIDLAVIDNYANQVIPAYVVHDNTPLNNPITDGGATLGRVLFYDKQLSSNGTVSCASCHLQEFGFGDTALVSVGVNGTTARHTMRLVNARFTEDPKFFWDERAPSLEAQTMHPIMDHVEMGFSGTNGDPGIDSLISRLNALPYYAPLFTYNFGDPVADTSRMKSALAQFIRSIQSFDSNYDQGRAMVNNDLVPNPNLDSLEDAGRHLFITLGSYDIDRNRIGGGLGCGGCHNGPEFDVTAGSGNNAVVDEVNGGVNYGLTRAPSLRNLFNPNGGLNGPMMHNGAFATLEDALMHYDSVPATTGTDFRLALNGVPSKLHTTTSERIAVEAFLRALTGSDVYTDPKWSDPFDANGDLTVIPAVNPGYAEYTIDNNLIVYPNPATDRLFLDASTQAQLSVFSSTGQPVLFNYTSDNSGLDISSLPAGKYFIQLVGDKKVRLGSFVKLR